MSKLVDRLIAEALFNKEPKVKKFKKEVTLKDFVKFQKDLKEFEEWQKSQKKDEKKPDTAWGKLSVVQKLTILMITVPLGLMLEMFFILKFAIVIGSMIKPT